MFFEMLLKVSLVCALLRGIAHGQYQDGDVRLVGGSYQWEGRVEVYMSGVWGTITDSDWTNDDATVVCRKLGHFRPGATAHSNAYFGEGKGPVNLDSVICSGSEYILTDCELQNSGLTTSHSLDVGVKCQPAYGSYREEDIRLVGGPHNWEGRVEIFWKGQWGTISDSPWTTSDALVVCKQLQHAIGSGDAVSCCNKYGRGRDGVHIENVACTGSETNITQCTYYTATSSTTHDQDVGVTCQRAEGPREGEIRLNRTYGTTKLWEGRVEIYLFGEWGIVCDDGSSNIDAHVVCRQLGYYTYGSSYACCSRFGQGSGPIHFRGLGCSGTEHRLTDCQNLTSSCHHGEDWSVYCHIDGPEVLDIRLTNSYYGYVQVFSSNTWIPVADTNHPWTTNNAKVVCRQLGYNASATNLITSYYGINSNYETMDDVMCIGTEPVLTDCPYNFRFTAIESTFRIECGYHTCSNGDMLRLVGGDSEREGRVEICNNLRWGTACGKYWTLQNTLVVCRYLGFSDLLDDLAHYSSKRFGEGFGPVLADYVNCSDSEDNLDDCYRLTHYFGCSHENDIGIVCKPARCVDGQIKLAGTIGDYYGRVEICSDKRWETLSWAYWNQNNADVACSELGFLDSSSAFAGYGYVGGPRYSKYFHCTGRESRLVSCDTFDEIYTKSQTSDIGVICSQAYCSDGELRLMNGLKEWEGRLEVCYNRRWGTVGGDGWTETNSHVICNSLGYDISDEPANKSIPNAPSKPLYYHSIRCSRRHLSLLECGFKRYTDKTKTYPHAVVRCKKPICKNGELRLSGGSTRREGRLEICFNKRWGTIDGDGWTHTDTEVSCERLGYSNNVGYTIMERERYGSSQSLPVHMTLVGCYGSENNLTECSYHEFKSTLNVLSTSKDVRITCGGKPDSSAKPSAVANASLSISVILAVAVIILVVVIIFIFRRKEKSAIRNVTSYQGTKGSSRYTSSTQHNERDQTILHDNKQMTEDVPQETYEEMEVSNPLPVPPKAQQNKQSTRYVAPARENNKALDEDVPQEYYEEMEFQNPPPISPKQQQNKPSTSVRYTKPRNGGDRAKRQTAPACSVNQPHVQQRGQQQTRGPRSPSPVEIYETPDDND